MKIFIEVNDDGSFNFKAEDLAPERLYEFIGVLRKIEFELLATTNSPEVLALEGSDE